jgi:hypothetical protein
LGFCDDIKRIHEERFTDLEKNTGRRNAPKEEANWAL